MIVKPALGLPSGAFDCRQVAVPYPHPKHAGTHLCHLKVTHPHPICLGQNIPSQHRWLCIHKGGCGSVPVEPTHPGLGCSPGHSGQSREGCMPCKSSLSPCRLSLTCHRPGHRSLMPPASVPCLPFSQPGSMTFRALPPPGSSTR